MEKRIPSDLNVDWYELGLSEYMLLANPAEIVYNKVMEEKRIFYRN